MGNRVSGKTIICGGHATFLNAINKKLTGNVKYVGSCNFDITVLRNASVIWIQTNAISHSTQNKIMNFARAHNIPVRFFNYASAQKCADQILGYLQ